MRDGNILRWEHTRKVEFVAGSFLGREVLAKFSDLNAGDCFFRVDDGYKRYIKSVDLNTREEGAVCFTEVIRYRQMNPEEMVLRYPEEFREEA